MQLAGETHSMLAITLPNRPALEFEIRLPAYSWITETARYALASLRGDGLPAAQFGPWQTSGDSKLRYAVK